MDKKEEAKALLKKIVELSKKSTIKLELNPIKDEAYFKAISSDLTEPFSTQPIK